jgi:TPR repeat protein
MGDCCRLGLVGPADLVEAEAWYRLAAAQGHVGAIVLLATAIESSGELGPEAQAELFGLWLAAAAAGNADAQYKAACCYLTGSGCTADPALAARWLETSASQGHADAQYQLGLCHLRGHGVAQDAPRATEWLQRAAAQKHPSAAAQLAAQRPRRRGKKPHETGRGLGVDSIR